MNEAGWIALGSAVTAIVASVGVVIINVIKARHDTHLAVKKSTMDDYQEIFDRQQEQLKRLERQVDEQQKAINDIHADHTDCQLEMAELYGWLVRMHDLARRQSEVLKRLGADPEAVPELPPRRSRNRIDSGLVKRSTEHNTKLVLDPTGDGNASPPR